ncbi:MAG: diguanylate cyclase, partial [Myxococcales bacterium]|nr:diguanylate cyclase [Myxococcales bacterium]
MAGAQRDSGLARLWAALRSLARSPVESLPSRIIISVYAAALVTSVLVTGIATKSTETFLRSKIDERFPALLARTRQRLDTWYAQRELDIATFAASSTVVDSLDAAKQVSAQEARKYLAYVRESFPQYGALFVMDAAGRDLVAIGMQPSMPSEQRQELAALRRPGVSVMHGEGAARYQLISAPIHREGRLLGTFHAMVSMERVEALLHAEDFEATTRIYVVGPDQRVLARSPGAPDRPSYGRRLPPAGGTRLVEDYTDAAGAHLIGSAIPFPRFDWSLVVEESYEVAFAPVVGVYRRVLAINVAIVLVFGIVAFLIARSIVRPIRALSDGAHRIAQGETEVEIPATRSRDEIGVLSRALDAMVARLQRNQEELERKQAQIETANAELRDANHELRRTNEMLEQLSFTDGLTRLHNHRFFQERLQLEIKRSDRGGESLALVLLDIDNFKLLNDRYGHAVGDEVLRRVAHAINNNVRETDLPARYGGEEFAVLAPSTPREGAVALAEKLRMAVR